MKDFLFNRPQSHIKMGIFKLKNIPLRINALFRSLKMLILTYPEK